MAPEPRFLFQHGAGPLFDIGPYYLTALVQIFGPVGAGGGARLHGPRDAGRSGRDRGRARRSTVTVPSHVGALLEFDGGQSAQAIFSFDSALPRTLLEVTGTRRDDDPARPEQVRRRRPDPAARGTDDRDRRVDDARGRSRGTGVLDMARAIREGRPHRADGALAFHVLDVDGRRSASRSSPAAFVDVESRGVAGEPLPGRLGSAGATSDG